MSMQVQKHTLTKSMHILRDQIFALQIYDRVVKLNEFID